MGHYRSLASRRKIGSETPDGELPDPVSENIQEPMEWEYEVYRRQQLEKAILRLPPEQKEVVELRRMGISFNEIAAIQNCPLNTALGRMHKAVKTLRFELNNIE